MSARGPHEDERGLRESLDLLARRAPRAYDPPRPMLRRARRRITAIAVGTLLVVGSVTFGGITLVRALSEPPGPPVPIGTSGPPSQGPTPSTAPVSPATSPSSPPSPVPVRCSFAPLPLPDLPPHLRQVAEANGSFQLADADGASADDVWISGTVLGDFAKPAITLGVWLHWDGSTIGVVPPTNERGLGKVEVIGPDDGWATTSVGPLHWDGTSWSAEGNPVEGVSDLAVSGTAPDDVWVVGSAFPPRGKSDSAVFAEHFDGTRWTEVPTPSSLHSPFMALWGVAAVARDDVWAVGGDESDLSEGPAPPVVLHWDGSGWSEVETPVPGDNPYVGSAVAASGPDDVWVVARGAGPNFEEIPSEVLHWDGSTWSRVALPQTGGSVLRLAAVDAPSPDDVWVAGAEVDPASGVSTPVVLHFDGVAWAAVPLPVAAADGQGRILAVREIGGQVWAIGFTALHDPPFVSVCR